MTKADLVEQVTASIARTSGPMISKKDCARVVDAFLDAVKHALKEQHNIEVRGFGTFKIRKRKTRMARNPRTGESRSPPGAGVQAQQGVAGSGGGRWGVHSVVGAGGRSRGVVPSNDSRRGCTSSAAPSFFRKWK